MNKTPTIQSQKLQEMLAKLRAQRALDETSAASQAVANGTDRQQTKI